MIFHSRMLERFISTFRPLLWFKFFWGWFCNFYWCNMLYKLFSFLIALMNQGWFRSTFLSHKTECLVDWWKSLGSLDSVCLGVLWKLGLYTFRKFFKVNFSISISIKPPNNGCKLFLIGNITLISEKSFQIGLINILVVPIINTLECTLHCKIVRLL
jgi:hypothetical protein